MTQDLIIKVRVGPRVPLIEVFDDKKPRKLATNGLLEMSDRLQVIMNLKTRSFIQDLNQNQVQKVKPGFQVQAYYEDFVNLGIIVR